MSRNTELVSITPTMTQQLLVLHYPDRMRVTLYEGIKSEISILYIRLTLQVRFNTREGNAGSTVESAAHSLRTDLQFNN